MAKWFECKVKYTKNLETGMQKTVTENFLVDALSFAEAEARILDERRHFTASGTPDVTAIKIAKYSEVYFDGVGSRWFRCRVGFISLDEKSGAEKVTATNILVQASEYSDATENLNACMKGTMADWRVLAINETTLLDVYPYESKMTETTQQ